MQGGVHEVPPINNNQVTTPNEQEFSLTSGKVKPSIDFDSLMVEVKKHYPERSDYHQWSAVLKHLKKQLKTQKDADEFLEAVKIYYDDMKDKNNIGTRFVRGFHTFAKEKVYLDIIEARASIPNDIQPTQKEKTPEEIALAQHVRELGEQMDAEAKANMEERRRLAYQQ